MKISKIILTALIISGLVFPSMGCTTETDSTPGTEDQVATVERGSIVIDVTAAGNLALSRMEDLAFEISGTELEPLTVEEVLVDEGDSVEEGQVLVTLDTTALEEKVADRERALKTAELNLRIEEIDLQDAKDAEKTVKTTQIDLEKAIDSYEKIIYPYDYLTFSFSVPDAVVAVHNAELQLEKIREGMTEGPGSDEYGEIWHQLTLAQENLKLARERLTRGVGVEQFVEYGDTAPLPVEDFWTLRTAQLSMEKAEITLEKAEDTFKSSLDKANIALEKAQMTLDEARENLEDARDELEKATIVAPFAGFVTQVNVEGGDEARKGTVAVQIADPDRFEAEVMVSEMDILQLKVGADASVQVDAMTGVSLPAKVTHISPTATIQSGVVNYQVKVELQSLQPVSQPQQGARQGPPQGLASGELPERLKQAIEEGRITEEQAEEMMKQRQQEQGGQPAQMPSVIPEDFQLREGLTVTVSIMVQEKKDVLLVPNRAITRREGKTVVNVFKDGAIEERAVQTGLSNWTQTEVTEGLSQGEQVVIPQTTSTTSQTSASRSPMPFIRH